MFKDKWAVLVTTLFVLVFFSIFMVEHFALDTYVFQLDMAVNANWYRCVVSEFVFSKISFSLLSALVVLQLFGVLSVGVSHFKKKYIEQHFEVSQLKIINQMLVVCTY